MAPDGRTRRTRPSPCDDATAVGAFDPAPGSSRRSPAGRTPVASRADDGAATPSVASTVMSGPRVASPRRGAGRSGWLPGPPVGRRHDARRPAHGARAWSSTSRSPQLEPTGSRARPVVVDAAARRRGHVADDVPAASARSPPAGGHRRRPDRRASCSTSSAASWLAVLVAVYSVGAHTDGRRRLSAIVGAGIADRRRCFVARRGRRRGHRSSTPSPPSCMFTAAFVLGDNVRRRRLHVESLADRAERAEREREILARERVAEERARIARELHDIVAHSVSVMVIQAAAARRNLTTRPGGRRGPARQHRAHRPPDDGRAAPGARRAAQRRRPQPLAMPVPDARRPVGARRHHRRPAGAPRRDRRRRPRPGRRRRLASTASCRRRSPTPTATPGPAPASTCG